MQICSSGISPVYVGVIADELCNFGTLTKKEAEVPREFLHRFIQICPDADNKIDPADRKRIARVKRILSVERARRDLVRAYSCQPEPLATSLDLRLWP
jgi:hypothetical protein